MVKHGSIVAAAALMSISLAAYESHADSTAAISSSVESARFALGVKRGDGMGNSPGVDVSWLAHPSVVLGVTGYYLPEVHGRGFALAPSIVFRTSDARSRLVPFASFGVKHIRRNFGGRWGKGAGGFGAVGLSWTFVSGVSLHGGFGFHGQTAVQAQDHKVTISQPSHGGFFLESGLRYWF